MKKPRLIISLGFRFAERAGFEPANPFGRSRAFQTRLFSHSSTSPLRFAGANINKNMLTL